jgi:hypothetical protein
VAVTVGFELKSGGISLLCGDVLARDSAGVEVSSVCAAVPDPTRSFSQVYPRVSG